MLSHMAQQAPTGDFLVWSIISVGATIGGFIAAFVFLHRARVIEDTPTSRIRSAAQGYVELEGMVQRISDPLLSAPLTDTPCLWYEYQIERYVRGSGKSSSGHWVTTKKERSSDQFWLVDETGKCIIDPEGASVVPDSANTDRWYGRHDWPQQGPEKRNRANRLFSHHRFWNITLGGGKYRYTERRIPEATLLYAIGLFTTAGAHDARDRSQAISDTLRQWKQDQTQMLTRFDTDQDGNISMGEWEAARRLAAREVDAANLQRINQGGLNLLGATGEKRKPFLLSAVLQQQLVKRYRLYSGAAFVLFLAATAVATSLIIGRFT